MTQLPFGMGESLHIPSPADNDTFEVDTGYCYVVSGGMNIHDWNYYPRTGSRVCQKCHIRESFDSRTRSKCDSGAHTIRRSVTPNGIDHFACIHCSLALSMEFVRKRFPFILG